MINIFFLGFILLFWGGYIWIGALVAWGTVTTIALLLNATLVRLGSILRPRIKKVERAKSTKRVRLDDPIGAMSVISHRYNAPMFLKDLAFLEVEIFGKNSAEVIMWFQSAKSDPRPEVCGASAVNIILVLARARQESISQRRWTEQQEKRWASGVPSEFLSLLSETARARSA